jgi:hypothetical protein
VKNSARRGDEEPSRVPRAREALAGEDERPARRPMATRAQEPGRDGAPPWELRAERDPEERTGEEFPGA